MVNRTSAARGADANMPMPPPFDAAALLEASRPTLSAAAEVNGRLYETVAALNTEYVGFVNRRLKEDLGLPQQFAACRTLEDLYGVYTGFFQRAVEQYRDRIRADGEARTDHGQRRGQSDAGTGEQGPARDALERFREKCQRFSRKKHDQTKT